MFSFTQNPYHQFFPWKTPRFTSGATVVSGNFSAMPDTWVLVPQPKEDRPKLFRVSWAEKKQKRYGTLEGETLQNYPWMFVVGRVYHSIAIEKQKNCIPNRFE